MLNRRKIMVVSVLALFIASSMSRGVAFTSSSEPISDFSIPELKSIDSTTELETQRPELIRHIVFVDTTDEYYSLLENYDTVYRFPNMRAVVVDIDRDQFETLSSIGQVFQMDRVADALRQTRLISPVESISGVSLQASEDAISMGVKPLWDKGYTGNGVVVGIIDSGVETTHPGLAGRIVSNTWFEKNTSGVRDPFHGTPVAGTIVGTGDDDARAIGNAYNATLISAGIRLIDGLSLDAGPDGINLLEAYEYMLSLASTIDVLNLSIGGFRNPALDYIFERFEEEGVVVVASAGNEGPDSGTVGCPACYIQNIGVAATDGSNARLPVTSFSSRGPGAFPGMKPDVAAPGQNVYSTLKNSEYGEISGTSFSSPLTAGAIATLISALEAEGYTYNVGSIKAAILRGAYTASGSSGDYEKGAGDVRADLAYDYLKATNPSPGFAKALAVTPLDSSMFTTSYFRGLEFDLDGFTVIASNPSDVTFSLSGDITSILSVNTAKWSSTKYSQYAPLHLNTKGAESKTYSGTLTVTMGSETQTVNLQYTVTGDAKGIVAMDLYHTDWDNFGADKIGGTNTGKMAAKFVANGFWVVETDEAITDSFLSKYDILWMPDPLSKTSFAGEDLTTSEITAIQNYIKNGGNVVIDFNGPFVDEGRVGGVDPAKINALTSDFGITSYSDPNDGSISVTVMPVNNVTTLAKGAHGITQAGNYLKGDLAKAKSAGGYLYAITGDYEKSNLLAYEKFGGGKLVVTSTNFWMDNSGLSGSYPADGDVFVAQNMINWFEAEDQLVLDSLTEGDAKFSGSLKASSEPTITHRGGEGTATLESSGTDTYSFDFEATGDGIHEFEVLVGSVYVNFDVVLDLTGPQIVPLWMNNTQIGNQLKYAFPEFNITDSVYDVKFDDIRVKLDGEDIDPTKVRTLFSDHTLQVRIPVQELDLSASHYLTIEADDDTGHTSVLDWYFTFIEGTSIISTTDEPEGGFLPLFSGVNIIIALSMLSFISYVVGRKRRK